ncbi:MAG: hypothetical protein WCB53_18375 [Terriglobales bacterium]
MALKFGTWMIAVGCFFGLAALGFFSAAFSTPRDASAISAGAMLFSFGMVLAAAGFYMKARSFADADPSRARAGAKSKRRICNQCGTLESAVECRVHHLHLCADCLTKHYEFKSCVYVPSPRQTYSKIKSQAATA